VYRVLRLDSAQSTLAKNQCDEHWSKELNKETERLLVGLAANLASYTIMTSTGEMVEGRNAGWPGSNCAYAHEPAETINYVSAHDNETLFDMMVWKVRAGQGPDAYARRSLLCSAFIAYAQGVPFFHAGDDTLRSKSLDRDSYNSGDHFNRLDWTLSTNNFGVGLPPKSKNEEKWPDMRRLLADKANIAPTPELIARSASVFREVLSVRYSSPLFRLRTAAEIKARVRFHNCGPDASAGVVVMELSDGPQSKGLTKLDTAYSKIIVIFNARPEPYTHQEVALADATKGFVMELHPVLAQSVDEGTRSASWAAGGFPTVPACTAAVFVARR